METNRNFLKNILTIAINKLLHEKLINLDTYPKCASEAVREKCFEMEYDGMCLMVSFSEPFRYNSLGILRINVLVCLTVDDYFNDRRNCLSIPGLVERSTGKYIIDGYDMFFKRFEPCDKPEEQMKQNKMEEWIIKYTNENIEPNGFLKSGKKQ